jgi:hypothetical protein
MSAPPTLFQSLSNNDKVDFFVKCQRLLIESHPTSPFLFTKQNYDERKAFVLDFVHKYKGYCYADENVAVLFNLLQVNPTNNPARELKKHLYQPPAGDFNTISIDFVVFKQLGDCLRFITSHDNPQIQFVLYAKNNAVKLYDKQKILSNLPIIGI